MTHDFFHASFFSLGQDSSHRVGLKGLHGFEFPSAASRPPTRVCMVLLFSGSWAFQAFPKIIRVSVRAFGPFSIEGSD